MTQNDENIDPSENSNFSIVKIAVGVGDDPDKFFNKHFGESKEYLIYKMNLDTGEYELIKRFKNTSPHERMHGDPVKAKKVSEILKDVDILLAHLMGPNLQRMQKKYIIILSRLESVKESLKRIPNLSSELKEELKKVSEIAKKGENEYKRQIFKIKE
ncbi:MAG: NifB/NifX family molybdenum-iron cluster-binding protein [Promethearchaeota archaeon]